MDDSKKVLVAMIGAPSDGYKETKYLLEGEKVASTFSFYAINKKYRPHKIYLIGTRDSIWTKIPEDLKYEEVLIDYGVTEKEHWAIFNTLTRLNLDDQRVIFDLTYGFRTLPLICLLSIIYYKAIHPKMKIDKILYGMYDARDKENITSVVDLVDFFKIVDWLYAAKIFAEFGLGSALSEQIKDIHNEQLTPLADGINNLSTTLQMIYLNLLRDNADKVNRQLSRISASDEAFLSPLRLIEPEISRLIGIIRRQGKDWEYQLSMAEWYFQNHQYAHTIITLRETVITFIGESLDAPLSTREDRKKAEELIYPKIRTETQRQSKEIKRIFSRTKIPSLLNEITDIRNRVGHALVVIPDNASVSDANLIKGLIKKSKEIFSDVNTKSAMESLKKYVIDNSIVNTKVPTTDDLEAKYNS